MKALFPCLVAAASWRLPRSVSAEGFKAAAAKMITPDPLLPVSGGMGTPKPTTEKRGDLWVRAFVFDGKARVALVSVDNLGWPALG